MRTARGSTRLHKKAAFGPPSPAGASPLDADARTGMGWPPPCRVSSSVRPHRPPSPVRRVEASPFRTSSLHSIRSRLRSLPQGLSGCTRSNSTASFGRTGVRVILLKKSDFRVDHNCRATEALREFLARGSAFGGPCLPMSFLASPHARLPSDQAVAATEPFFDEMPIQGFFNIG